MDLDLNGRVAVVTGASKGIGLAVVRALLEEGVCVVAASRSAMPDLDGELVHVPVDLMDPDAPAEVIARAVEAFGGLDILVNNAGGPPPGDSLPHAGFLSRDDDQWRAMFEFNLLSAVRACRAALPLLLERGGSIINVTSVNARQPAAMNMDYCASKAALLNLTKALSEEFGPRGVRVNSVSPGPTLTPWWTDAGGAGDILGRLDQKRWGGRHRHRRAGADAADDRALRRAAGDRRRRRLPRLAAGGQHDRRRHGRRLGHAQGALNAPAAGPAGPAAGRDYGFVVDSVNVSVLA